MCATSMRTPFTGRPAIGPIRSGPWCSRSPRRRSPARSILATGFTRADGIASLLIATIMLKAAD